MSPPETLLPGDYLPDHDVLVEAVYPGDEGTWVEYSDGAEGYVSSTRVQVERGGIRL